MLKNANRRHQKFYEDSLLYGPNWTITVPTISGDQVMCTVDPAVVEHILSTNFQNYIKGNNFYTALKPLLGDGIFNVNGESWRWQRKLSSHIFTGRMFRDVVGKVVRDDVARLIKKLGEAADKGDSVDLHQYFHNFTLDTFGKIGFGDDFESLETPDKPPAFAVAFDSTLAVMVMRMINMFWPYTERLFPGKPTLSEHLRVIDDFAMERIRNRRAMLAASGANGDGNGNVGEREGRSKDLLDLFMAVRKDDGEPLSDRQLRDVILNMILAGRDTTAQALSWTFLELTRHPEIVTKVREEAARVLGAGHVPAYDEVSKLKYANAIFMETLRLNPSVPANVKIAIKEDILPGGIYIPAGAEVNWFPYAMGRQTSLWGPDALEFKPERWLDEEGNLKRVSPFQAIAFNAGPRICLGQQMATVEGVMAIVALCDEFDFETVDKNQPDPQPALSLTHAMAGGLPVYVKRVQL
ncbi:hypothetical protein HK101_002503 [Irineochytrium annulatum]|nr:hypothetical protein HK101_002503 [Irineochytrium annulatum]